MNGFDRISSVNHFENKFNCISLWSDKSLVKERVTGFDRSASLNHIHKEVPLMLNINEKIIKYKVGGVNLTGELNNVSNE